LMVVGGSPGQTATVIVQTTPSALCAIVYLTPSGTMGAAEGLNPKRADDSGDVWWEWIIATTDPGMGTVAVSCAGARATTGIAIR
jgi:hypothetical protein